MIKRGEKKSLLACSSMEEKGERVCFEYEICGFIVRLRIERSGFVGGNWGIYTSLRHKDIFGLCTLLFLISTFESVIEFL